VAKAIALDAAPTVHGSRYPAPYDAPCAQRFRRRLGDVAGLTQFGVNLTRLPAGAWSAQRHWHSAEDEFIYVLEGELVLVTDSGEETLRAGDCAGFKAGVPDGHHLLNRSEREALYLEVGGRRPGEDAVVYPDIDLRIAAGRAEYLHSNGEPYLGSQPRIPGKSL
jgi:uncharacterized cupin superfamily protein